MMCIEGGAVPCENLSKKQRSGTPYFLCQYLIMEVKRIFNCQKVAVLWVMKNSLYEMWGDEVCLWGEEKDARKYEGQYPVICHPPCGPWGKYKSNCFESREHGIIAIDFVHRWGGVVEHPVGSSLFMDHGRGGRLEKINQFDYGHRSIKPTYLYWVDRQGG